jgi:predicted secreted acid phosphatase
MTKQKEKPEPKVYPTYIAKDFFQMEAELEKFAIDKEMKKKNGTMEMVHFVPTKGVQQWYIDNGALSNREDWTVRDIPKFQELQEKMDQYNTWQRRREFAQKKELEGLEELSKSMQII